MLKVAITGNIGSGKTTVCKIYESLGIPVFYADSEAKKLYRDAGIRTRVKEVFGEAIFDEKGELRRQKLANIVFHNPEALQQLNAIIHPAVMDRYDRWIQDNADKPYTLHEAAVIFENHLEKQFDFIITVSCPEDLRTARIRKRDGLSEKEIKNRMKRQWPDNRKAALSNAVIVNDGKHFLIPQVLKIHKILIQKSSAQNEP